MYTYTKYVIFFVSFRNILVFFFFILISFFFGFFVFLDTNT